MDKKFVKLDDVEVVFKDGDDSDEFEAIISSEQVDRDGEVIDFRALEPLPKHMTVDNDHDVKVTNIVGSGTPFYEEGTRTLKFKGRFASTKLAKTTRALVKDGHIRTMSIRFRRPEYEVKDDVFHITKAELLNVSFVPIPANTDALVTSVKSGLKETEESAGDGDGIVKDDSGTPDESPSQADADLADIHVIELQAMAELTELEM